MKADVRFLSKQFSRAPALANRGCIDRIRPRNGTWTIQAIKDFMEQIFEFMETPLLARITAVNKAVISYHFIALKKKKKN